MLFYNSMLSLPMLLGAVVLKGEPVRMADYPLLWHPTFQLVLLASSALGLTINHSTFVCTRVNEPLMTSVAGTCPCICCTRPAAAGCHFDFRTLVLNPHFVLPKYSTRAATHARPPPAPAPPRPPPPGAQAI
jgi:hypothetical protein